MFEDKNWLPKILIGAAFVLLSFFVIGIPFVLGYMMLVIKRSYENQEAQLPEWDNWGELFTKGLVAFIIALVAFVPGMLLWLISCTKVLSVFYFLFATFILPILFGKYAVTGDLNQVFNFNEIMELTRENIAGLAGVLMMSIIFTIISSLGIIALLIGFLFTVFYAKLGIGFLYGKIYQEAMKKKEAANVG
jgi:hypothetical protein